MRSLFVSALIGLSGVCLTHTPELRGQPNVDFDPELLQALIITGQNVHPWRETTPIMKQILEDTGRFGGSR